MNKEFLSALDALEKEKGIEKAILIEAVENALVSAYKKNYGTAVDVRVEVDPDSGAFRVFAKKTVAEKVEDETSQVSLKEAQKVNIAYEPGDVMEMEVTPGSFGRIAAQTAKQVVVHRLRDAERGVIYYKFIEREGEVLNASIHRVDKNGVLLEIEGAEGVMPASECIPGERYNANDHIKVYMVEVRKTAKGPQIIVSRSHPGLLKRLFEIEVPEVMQNIVQIKSIAREAGSRTKIAVYSEDENVDPVGACVGQKGSRIDRIVAELGNEKIDVIPWSADPVEYIANSLRPAKVLMVRINEEEKSAKVIVPDYQLSLAIGREGQNARLAAKLTGWKIDIKSQTQIEQTLFNKEEQNEPEIEIDNDLGFDELALYGREDATQDENTDEELEETVDTEQE